MQKTIFRQILIFIALIVGFVAQSQQGRMNGTPVGLDRSIGGGQRFDNTPRKVETIDYVKATVDNLTEQLNLDGFQSAILKNILEDYKKTTTAISEENIPNQAKFEKIKSEKLKMDEQIKKILNDDQKKLFAELKDTKSDKKKKKKNKKKESDSEENELF